MFLVLTLAQRTFNGVSEYISLFFRYGGFVGGADGRRGFAGGGGIRENIFGRPAGFGKIISAGRRDSEDNFFGRPAGFGRQFSGE